MYDPGLALPQSSTAKGGTAATIRELTWEAVNKGAIDMSDPRYTDPRMQPPIHDQASNQMTAPPPGQTTLSPPTSPPTPSTAERPATSTTGQGGTAQ